MKAGENRPFEQLDFKNSFIGPLIVALSFATLAIGTWQKGGDLFTDFGHQLYLAWRISEGEILYRDIPWLFGPLAHHVNALIFEQCGVAVSYLLSANLCLIAVLTAAIYSLAERVSNRLTATLAALVTLGIFCFGHLLEEGVFNFLTPYSHDATYGLTLCVLLILFCDAWARSKKQVFALLAGFCVGLAVLTKVELAIAALLIALTFLAFARVLKLRLPGLHLLVFGAVTPLAVGYFSFLRSMEAGAAFSAVTAAFSQLARGGQGVVVEPYQLKGLGFDDWKGNFSMLVEIFLLSLGLTAAALVADHATHESKFKFAVAFVAAFLIFALLFLKSNLFPWLDAPRFLTILCPTLLGIAYCLGLRAELTLPQRLTALTSVLWLTLASFLLLRLGLRARFYHYGFFLALPAAVSLIVAYVYYIPLLIRQRGGSGDTFRILTVAFLLSGLLVHLRYSEHYYSQRTEAIGSGADRLYLIPSEGASRTRRMLAGAAGTLSIIPSGALLNYFMRAANPTGFPILDLNVVRILGEQNILDRFKASVPARIVVVEIEELSRGKNTSAQLSEVTPNLWAWIAENYAEPLQALGADGSVFAHVYQSRRVSDPTLRSN